MTIKLNDYETREAWLEARNGPVIGGSQVAAILGQDPYCSPLELWQRKKGLLPPLDETQAMYWGNRKETLVADEWKRRNNRGFMRLRQPLATNSKYPFMIASPDRLVLPDGCKEGLECKAPGYMQRRFWGFDGDDIPRAYFLQCHHYMTVFEYDLWHCATLIGGDDYRQYTLPADKEISEAIIDACAEFVKLMEKDEPPDEWQKYWEDYRSFLDGKWKKNNGDLLPIASVPGILEQIQELRMSIAEQKEAELCVEHLKTGLQAVIGEADGITWVDADGYERKITWKRPKASSTTDWQAIAKALAGDDDIDNALIKQHSTPRKNSRKFIVPKSWHKGDK